MSVPGHHIMWILGVDTLDAALKKLEPFRLDGVVQKMRCPFLVVHGEDDEQIPLKDAQALYDASGSTDKTLRVFTAEEGGAQHCQRDYLSLGTATMWNWFEDKLCGRIPKGPPEVAALAGSGIRRSRAVRFAEFATYPSVPRVKSPATAPSRRPGGWCGA